MDAIANPTNSYELDVFDICMLKAKDLELAASSAQEVGLKCPFTSQAQEIYTELCKAGHEFRDFSCVFRHYYSGKDEI